MKPVRALLVWPMVLGLGSLPALADPAAPVLGRVVLSTAGLGQFDWSAEVAGPAELALTVDLDQVDDILKSLVVVDPAGAPAGVRLPGLAPLDQAFRALPFGPEALDDPAALLGALRGAEIALDGPRRISGRLVAVTVDSSGQGEAPRRHRLTLMTDDGLAQAVLEEAEGLRFLDPAVAAQVADGLAALRANRAQDARTLTVALAAGDAAPRRVDLTYVVAAPVWKAAYRLVLPEDGDGALLQGWAVVENATGTDWDAVELTLLSGNPVTFRQALYQSYYVPRPELPVQVVESVTPRTDAGIMESLAAMRFPAPAPVAAEAAFAPMLMAGDAAGPAVTAGEDDIQVSFRFDGAFDLPAGHTLLAPFLHAALTAERVWLYQPDTHPSFPLAAVSLENDSGATLPPGILTLYAGANSDHAGDAALPVLPAGESRLVTFALDRTTRIDRQEPASDQRLDRLTVERGVLTARREVRRVTEYVVRAPAERGRTLLIEHPRRDGWTLTVPAGVTATETPGHHRLRLDLAAGETARLPVTETRLESERIALLDLAPDRLLAWAEAAGPLDPDLRDRLAGLADQRRALQRAEETMARLRAGLDDLAREQDRLRANLAAVPDGSDLSRRYLADMAALEDRIAAARGERDAAEQALAEARTRFADAVAALN